MAVSRCPNPECSGSSFELKTVTPRKSNYEVHLIQCSSCGTVVGLIGNGDVLSHLHVQSDAIKAIADHLGVPTNL